MSMHKSFGWEPRPSQHSHVQEKINTLMDAPRTKFGAIPILNAVLSIYKNPFVHRPRDLLWTMVLTWSVVSFQLESN